MNITIITSTFPYPLKSGGAQAQYNFIDTLRKMHNISMIFPVNGKNTMGAMRHLQTEWPEVSFHPYSYFRQLMHGPFLKDKIVRAVKLKTCGKSSRFLVERALKPYGYYFTNDFLSFVNKVIKQNNTDLIQVEFYPYQHIVNYLPEHIRKIFVQHEIRYIRNKRLLADVGLLPYENNLFIHSQQEEIRDLNAYDQIIALTDTDKQTMENDGVKTPIFVSPAAVNTPVKPYQEWRGTLTFVGGYSHIPNQEGMEWFISQVLPLIQTEQVRSINIIGAGWPKKYEQIHPKLHFLGFVDDLQQHLQGSLVIVPILTGSGMRMKILDAAATGVPFVTTSVGVEGLRFEHGQSCVIADTPEKFAAAVNELISNQSLMKIYAEHAQLVFNKFYSVPALSDVRNQVYSSVMSEEKKQ